MRALLTSVCGLAILFATCLLASTSHGQLVVNVDNATFDVAAFQANDSNLPATSAGFGVVNVGGFVGARGDGALVSSPIATATGTTTLSAETTGTPSNNGFAPNGAAYNSDLPILDSNLFADGPGEIGFDVLGLSSLDVGSIVTVTVYGIGDNIDQDSTITASFGATTFSESTVYNTPPAGRGDATGSMPFVQFTFTADGTTDLIDVDVAAGPGGQNRSHLSGFSVSVATEMDCLIGDVNMSGSIDFSDIAPFIAVLSSGEFLCEADINEDLVVDFADIAPFIALLSGA